MDPNCTHVSPSCPVSATLYGDYFTLGATATFAAIFGLMLVAQIYLAWKAKLWSFGAWLFCGTAFEWIGYVLRCIMVDNPWNRNAFIGQMTTLVLGPTLVAAAISLTFKHLVIWHGPEYSLIRPRFYPVVFVGSDLVSIMIQGAGGGIASAADSQSMIDVGNNMLLGGVAFQVFNMIFCGMLILAYAWRRRQSMSEGPMQLASEWQEGRRDVPLSYQGTSEEVSKRRKSVRVFVISLAVAYIAILCRCIYRVVEMAMGWGSTLMKNETLFMILDGGLLMIACGVLTVFHPTLWFPFMSKRNTKIDKQESEVEMCPTKASTQPATPITREG